MRREELIEAIWPQAAWGQHDGALRVLLSAVRRVFGPDALTGRLELRLELPSDVWIDVEQAAAGVAVAERALREERLADAVAAARAAATLVAEPFLAGETGAWIEDARRDLDDLAVSALELEAGAELRRGRPNEAARAARELVARAPYRERGHALLMEALAAQGNSAEALIAYERLRLLLRDELGTTPSRAVSDLHARLLAGAEHAGTPPVPPALDVPRLPLPVALAPVDEMRFVGREAELGAIGEAWRAARAGARRVILIAGEPGIGKTSLVGELARRAEADGAVVLYGRCDEDVGFAFQPFVEALRAYVSACPPALLREQAGRGAPELTRVLPELSELLGDVTPPPPPAPRGGP